MFNSLKDFNLLTQKEIKEFLGEYSRLLQGDFADMEKALLLLMKIKILRVKIESFIVIFRFYSESAMTVRCREIVRVVDDNLETVVHHDEAKILKDDLVATEQCRCWANIRAVSEALAGYLTVLSTLKEQLQNGLNKSD